MMIDRISSIDPIQPEKKPGGAAKTREIPDTDSINISEEAVRRAEEQRAIEMVKAAPDVRMDRVEELRAKINDPSYINEKVLQATADRLLDALFG
jgi:negative regulator of flagellin synthesis FlgM